MRWLRRLIGRLIGHLIGRLRRRLPPLDASHLALDLEATGLDPSCDEILSCGVVPIRDGVIRWGERRTWRVRPAGDGASDAVVVHGLLPDETEDAMGVRELVRELEPLLDGSVLVVHGGRLDLGLLRRAFRDARRRWPRPRVVDTVHLLRRLNRRRGIVEPFAEALPTQLGAARSALGLPAHVEHDAVQDALATAELYLLLRRRLA